MDAKLIALLQCPTCRAPLQQQPGKLICGKKHRFKYSDQYINFVSHPDQGKYNEDYSKRYAFLWSYGYETRNSGLVESLYRSVGSLFAEAVSGFDQRDLLVVDCGCGTGRCLADAALLAPSACFLGVDLSIAKLNLASKILKGQGPVKASLPELGFAEPLSIHGRNLPNVLLARADALSLPLQEGSADIVLSVNLLDRVPDPRRALQEARRILRPGGVLILTTPLNWTEPDFWRKYPDAKALRELVVSSGFAIKTWFDQLSYREILDARGSVEEFSTTIIYARVR